MMIWWEDTVLFYLLSLILATLLIVGLGITLSDR